MEYIQLNRGYDTLTQQISLDGQAYDFYLKWLSRDESFEMKVALAGQKPTITTKLTTNSDLLAAARYIEGMPKGIMSVMDSSDQNGRISYEEFGTNRRFRLIYIGVED